MVGCDLRCTDVVYATLWTKIFNVPVMVIQQKWPSFSATATVKKILSLFDVLVHIVGPLAATSLWHTNVWRFTYAEGRSCTAFVKSFWFCGIRITCFCDSSILSLILQGAGSFEWNIFVVSKWRTCLFHVKWKRFPSRMKQAHSEENQSNFIAMTSGMWKNLKMASSIRFFYTEFISRISSK